MKLLYRYFFVILIFAALSSCSRDESDSETTPEMVEISFSPETRAEGSSEGDLIGVLLNHYTYSGQSGYIHLGQYIVSDDGTIVTNGAQSAVRYGSYYVMYVGVEAGTKYIDEDEKEEVLTQIPDYELYGSCLVYNVHRSVVDKYGNSDIYVGIPDVTYLYFTGNSLIYNSTSSINASYILDADIELKQQYSQMKFTLQSNKQEEAVDDESSSDAGHVITEIGITNLIDSAKVCAIHGLHVETEDVSDDNIELIYETDNNGEILVTEKKTLTYVSGEESSAEYINIISGDYSEIDAVTSEAVLPSPTIYVTYAGSEGSAGITNYLPLMVDLEPQTRYQFDITLTVTQINVTVYKVSGWIDGGDIEHTITKIASYSINVDNDADIDTGWDDNHNIEGSI